MDKRTTIQIENRTLNRMKKKRIARKETYDEVINRLIDAAEKYEEFEKRYSRKLRRTIKTIWQKHKHTIQEKKKNVSL